MALEENGGGNGLPATMLVGPANLGNAAPYPYPVYGMQNGNNGGFGGDWAWLVLLLLLAGGGWGGMGGFGGGMMWPMMMGAGMGGFGLGYDFPWLLTGQQGINNNVSDGFRDAQIHDSITSVRDGVSNLATQLCGCCGDIQMSIAGVNQGVSNAAMGIQNSLCQGFAGTTAAVTGAQNAIAQQMYSDQIADLNRSFDAQTATTAGMTNIAQNLQNCCCENRANIADLKYVVGQENCADRAAVSDGIRDVIANQTGNTTALLNTINGGIQSIKDQLCADKIDAKNDLISQLRQELLYSRGQASQDVQTARILAGQTSEVDALYNRLSNCPVPTVPVYGRQPIFTCNNNNCGCGCNGGNGGFV